MTDVLMNEQNQRLFDNPLSNMSSLSNSSLNKNNSSDSSDYFYQVEQLTFLWLLFALIVVGNCGVLVALGLSSSSARGARRVSKSRMHFFIRHLAIADLSVGLISVLVDIVWKITISWQAGLVACKLIRFLQALVTYGSTYVLVAMSIDRYDAIRHPMNFGSSKRRSLRLIISAWAVSAIFSTPILHFYQTQETEHYGTQCWIDFDAAWKWRLYMTLVALTVFVVPAAIIAFCYVLIVVTIWSKGRTNSSETGVLMGHSGQQQDLRRVSSRGIIPKAKVKTVKMTFGIVFVFILCWSPYIIFDLLQVYGFIPDTPGNRALATFIQSLAPLNSAANPFIYCLFSTNAGRLCLARSRKTSNNTTNNSNNVNNAARARNNANSSSNGTHSALTSKLTTLNSSSNDNNDLQRTRAKRAVVVNDF